MVRCAFFISQHDELLDVLEVIINNADQWLPSNVNDSSTGWLLGLTTIDYDC